MGIITRLEVNLASSFIDDLFSEPGHPIGGLVQILTTYVKNSVGHSHVGVCLRILEDLVGHAGASAAAPAGGCA